MSRPSGERVVIVFEGRDADGKGGTIKLHALPYDGKDKEVAVPADPDIVAPPG